MKATNIAGDVLKPLTVFVDGPGAEVPGGGGGGNMLLYVVIAVIAAAAVIGVRYFVIRKK